LAFETFLVLTILIFAAAVLYSSVGHAGASGYIAAMALVGVSSTIMKPTALCLNILVATITTIQFARAKCFSWRLFLPFALASVPMAYVGGRFSLPGKYFGPVIGFVLLCAGIRLLFQKQPSVELEPRAPMAAACLGAGAAIGLLAGLTGTGGGIFLTPLVLFMGWARPKEAAGVSAAFILVNSIAGLIGLLSTKQQLPPELPWWALAATMGALIGSQLGSRRLPSVSLKRLLGVVLLIAAAKMFMDPGGKNPANPEPRDRAARVTDWTSESTAMSSATGDRPIERPRRAFA
jgi:uncharacterized membrane protein YfcA